MVKYLVAPARMPDELTWFKWEAYTTWLSGFALLVVVYYLGAELFLIDKSVLDLTRPGRGRSRSAASLLAWLFYEALCRSPLGQHEVALALVGYVFLVGLTYALHPCVQRARRLHPDRRADRHHHGGECLHHRHPEPEEDRGRAAWPARRRDPRWGEEGKQRSVHNNYLTLPVVFLMICQSLSADVRDAIQLADRRDRARDRAGHPPFLQFPARGQGQPMVDLGRWRPPA